MMLLRRIRGFYRIVKKKCQKRQKKRYDFWNSINVCSRCSIIVHRWNAIWTAANMGTPKKRDMNNLGLFLRHMGGYMYGQKKGAHIRVPFYDRRKETCPSPFFPLKSKCSGIPPYYRSGLFEGGLID